MEDCSSRPPMLLDLIPNGNKEWVVVAEGKADSAAAAAVERCCVEKKLELRLGLPGDNNDKEWSSMNRNRERRDESLFSMGYYSNGNHHQYHQQAAAAAAASSGCVWFNQQQKQQREAPPALFHHHQFPTKTDKQQRLLLGTVGKESSPSQPCCTKVGAVDLQHQQQASVAEKKAFLSPPPPPTTAVPNTSQKRTAPGPVVGWPPIRSFRKNLSSNSSSSKQQPQAESKNGNPNKKAAPVEVCKKGLFVKINMDGVPIGRKVDLTAYDSYQRLSTAVDDLFRGLLAAQRDPSNKEVEEEEEEEKAITGLLDGSGEYTLVYEDNEGDRMLVGDVPWHMFVSTVKRLRVLKSSEVSALTRGCNRQEKMIKQQQQPLK